MPKINESNIVEMNKIVNNSPFETLWVYWEHDIVFNIENSSFQIKVTTHDKTLSDYPAYIGSDDTFSPLPVGIYPIGTYSNSNTDGGYDKFKIVCATQGYVSHVLNDNFTISPSEEALIPNYSETYIEKYATVNHIVPFFKESAPGDYRDGADYNNLIIKSTQFTLNQDNSNDDIIDDNIGCNIC